MFFHNILLHKKKCGNFQSPAKIAKKYAKIVFSLRRCRFAISYNIIG